MASEISFVGLIVVIVVKLIILCVWLNAKSEKKKLARRQARIDYMQVAQNIVETIRGMQALQMREAMMATIPFPQTADLIISVDSNSFGGIGGYCLDLANKSCEYYSLNQAYLPWTAPDNGESGTGTNMDELKMKNLLFAMLLWERQITQKSRVDIYVDSEHAFKPIFGPFAELAGKFIEHFNKCTMTTVSYVVVDNASHLETYSKFVQPAGDLCEGQLPEALTYLKAIYRVEALKGAFVDKSGSGTELEDPHDLIKTVMDSLKKWQNCACPGAGCNYRIHLPNSMQEQNARCTV